ncbi:MAG: S8 family serine peptidase [Pseudomonadota bacterium]|nr:MAG: S8 family serine peptidase [Pseudomonadota bacterium]
MKTRHLILAVLTGLALAVVAIAGPVQATSEPVADRSLGKQRPFVDPVLRQNIEARGSADMFIYLKARADLSPALGMGWQERGQFVYETLSQMARESQADLRAELDALGADYQAFWIDNVISVDNATAPMLNALAQRNDVQAIIQEPVAFVPDPERMPNSDSGTSSDDSSINAPVSSLVQINAPDVWALGYTGQGVTVGIIDSGTRYTHDALVNQYRGNLGGGSFDHNYNWFDVGGSTSPQWPNPHGTHVTGTAVGDDGGANQVGVAPGAEWISCLGCTSSSCPGANLLACAQFMAAPTDLAGSNPNPSLRPQVVNNSWGDCGTTYDNWYQGSVDAWVAAGIVPMVSNGNASNCGYSSPPGPNTVGNPARYGSVMGIGSSGNSNGQYANHSNWGPTDNPNDGTNPALPDPMGFFDLKPNVIAPGVSICSAYSTGDSNYTCGFTGTSMSSPAATGLVALMLSAAPSLMGDYATLGTIIMQTATPIPYATGVGGEGPGNVPNYATGWGEINALAAVQGAIAAAGPLGTIAGTVTEDGTGLPISGADVEITDGVDSWQTTTAEDGSYSQDVPEATGYTVNFAAFGYQADSATAVDVIEDQTTTVDAQLLAAADHVVSGTVTDSTTGWPLHAEIGIDGFPGSPIYTDPADGTYSVTLPEGMAFDFTVTALSGGYDFETRTVGPLTGAQVENFGLDADLNSCEAPGYSAGASTVLFEDFESTFPPAGWTVNNLGGDCDWARNDAAGRPNYAGGNGFSANGDSDACGSGTTMDTELVSPSFALGASADLEFILSYRHLGSSQLDVDVSTDGGSSWSTVTSYTASIDATGPGAPQSLDLSAFAGQPNVQVRFRYISPGWNYWAQVDNVEVISGGTCNAQQGEIVVGRVTDANNGDALIGATVEVDGAAQSTTTGTSPDPALGDGAYTLFVPQGTQTVIASETGYEDGSLADTFVDGNARRADFALNAGRVSATPSSLSQTVTFGDTDSGFLVLVNDGTAQATVTATPLDLINENFESAFPPSGWTVDDLGGDCVWQRNDAWPRANFAGGDGFSAAADSDACGSGTTMDTALVSPAFTANAASSLDFVLSYNDLGGSDQLDVDVSDDAGASWTTVTTYNTDIDASGPGAPQSIDLSAYAGSNIQVRFRYISGGWNWWAQVDQIEIAGAVDWLSVTPDNGTFSEGAVTFFDTLNVTVNYNAAAPSVTEPGVYNASILVTTDTPYGDIVVPVEMVVEPAASQARIAGTVTSLGYCDANPQLVEGATVDVNGATYSLTTDANGEYELWLDTSEAPLSIAVSAADHVSQIISGVPLTGTETTTRDFDLRLDAACPDTTPEELSSTLLPDETDSLTLTLDNTGAADVNWTTDTALPNAVAGGTPESGAIAGGNGNAGALDVRSRFDELPIIDGLNRIRAIDCDTADALVVHDDGSIENGYSGNASVVSEVAIVEYFEPDLYPALVDHVCVAFVSLGPDTLNYELVVFAADGVGGGPGTELAAVPATATGIPGGGIPATVPWYSVDLSAEGLTLESGGLYFGVRYAPLDPGVFLASDQSPTTPLQTGFFQTDGGAWGAIQDSFPDYRAMFVRPQLPLASGCASPETVPWLSVSPASGMTPAGGSSSLTVDIDSTGLAPGVYEAEVCVLTDDAQTPLLFVPVSLTVDVPGSFGTVEGNVMGLGYCSEDPNPAAGAAIEIVSQANTYNLTADANGDYSLSLDAAEAPLTITASAPSHLDGVASGVGLTAGNTTVVDFDLKLDAPCARANPDVLGAVLEPDSTASESLSLINDGAADYTWSIDFDEIAGNILGTPVEVVADGGFEGGTPNADWDEASTSFGTPLCDVAGCGTGGGTGPNSGDWWAWFGGISTGETGSVAQEITIPSGSSASLSFFLEIPAADTPGFLEVSLGGDLLFTVTEADAGTYATYDQVVLDVSSYADGGTYELRFDSTIDSGATTNFFVDDVSLLVVPGGPGDCSDPQAVGWVSVDQASGTVSAESSDSVSVDYDSTGLAPALYEASLCLSTSDGNADLIIVPVSLRVDSDEVFEDRFEGVTTAGERGDINRKIPD